MFATSRLSWWTTSPRLEPSWPVDSEREACEYGRVMIGYGRLPDIFGDVTSASLTLSKARVPAFLRTALVHQLPCSPRHHHSEH